MTQESQFPSNSRTSKQTQPEKAAEEAPKVQRVVQGDVSRRKTSIGKKFSQTFIKGDATSVWEYLVFDELIPRTKDLIVDATIGAVEQIVLGERRTVGRRTTRPGVGGGVAGRVNYSAASHPAVQRANGGATPELSRRARSTHDFDEIVLADKYEALAVIDQMFELLSNFNRVTVTDLYNLVGITPDYTDSHWGWVELPGARADRLRNGDYVLNLPAPISLKGQ